MSDENIKTSFIRHTDKRIETHTVEMYWMCDDILRINMKEGAEIDLEEAIHNFNAGLELTGGKPCLKLVDARGRWNVSNEAREHAAKHETKENTLARAVLVDSLAGKLVSNFFIRFNKPQSPVRIFNDEAKAIEWLRKKLK